MVMPSQASQAHGVAAFLPHPLKPGHERVPHPATIRRQVRQAPSYGSPGERVLICLKRPSPVRQSQGAQAWPIQFRHDLDPGRGAIVTNLVTVKPEEATLRKDKDSLLTLSQVVAPVDPRQGKRGVLSYGLKSILKVGGESFSGTSFAQRISSRRQLCGHARDDRRRRKPCPSARLYRCVDAASRRIQSPPPAAAIALLGRAAS